MPGKVLLALPNGRTVIDEVLLRCRLIPGIDCGVVAVSDDPLSDLIARHIEIFHRLAPQRFSVVRGSEDDVLSRYIRAAEEVKADTIMRVTSDCPLIDPNVCGQVLQAYKETGADYCCNFLPERTWPHGYDCEVFPRRLLYRAADANEEDYPGNKGGVDVWMIEAPGVKRHSIQKPGKSEGHRRLTLDTIEDLRLIWEEMERRLEASQEHKA